MPTDSPMPDPIGRNAMSWRRLGYLGVVRFSGPDAAAFLQGQVSNDTRRLRDGQPLLAAYSTPQGRVLAIMHLLPHSSGILALLPREVVLPTVERLRRYVLRAKVTIEDLSDQFSVSGRWLADAGGEPYREVDTIGVGRVGPDATRLWAVGSTSALTDAGFCEAASADAGAVAAHDRDSEWRLADIRAGLPQIHAATREMFVAQMLNLDLVDGISFNKGCFTGQEIIARTQHLGRIKRRLFRLRLPAGTWTVSQSITLADGRTGRLTEVEGTDAGYEALAVLPLKQAGASDEGAADAAGSEQSGTAVDAVILPLPYALTSP